jgi:hypothetical protein
MRKTITFRLTTGKTEGTWSIRGGSAKKNGVAKFINYWPGCNSIFDEDNEKTSVKPQSVTFRYNDIISDPACEIIVPEENKALLDYLMAHPYFNLHYKIYNEDITAQEKLAQYDTIEAALNYVNDSDDVKVQAIAMALFGQQTAGWSVVKCKSELKKKAFEASKQLLEEIESPIYADKYIVGLAILRGFIEVNDTNTAVVWTDNKGALIKVAVGEDPINELAKFLGTNTDDAIITKQKLGKMAEQSNSTVAKEEAQASSPATAAPVAPVKETPAPAPAPAPVVEKVVEAPVAEAKVETPAPVVEEKAKSEAPAIEEVKTVEAPKATEEKISDSKVYAAANTPAPAVDETVTPKYDPTKEYTLDELKELYPAIVGKGIPVNKKNDGAWILNGIKEKVASAQ